MAEPGPAISVVIPLYNKGDCVGRALRSVLMEQSVGLEIVIVDDGSSDHGPAVVAGFRDRRIRLVRQENAGPGAARNSGLRRSRGNYVVFLDADDELLPGYLPSAVGNLRRHPRCMASVSAHYRGPRRQRTWPPDKWGLTIAEGPWRLPVDCEPRHMKSAVDCFASGAVLCSRETVQRFGGFFEHRCTYGEDSYLWLQVLLNYPVFFDPVPRMWYHTEDSMLGLGRVGAYPVWPQVWFPELIRQNCPRTYLPALERCLDLYALQAVRRCILGEDWRTAVEILQDYPRTAALAEDFRNVRWKAVCSWKAWLWKLCKRRGFDRIESRGKTRVISDRTTTAPCAS